jgi:O-acetyl-ADP-ribose deacetylase (regulator of RNase III)
MTISEVKFFLRDRNSELADAWTRYFKGIEDVEVSCGDIFDLQADAVVSPANSFGFMDGGIDLVYSHYFGWELQERLRELLRKEHDGELPVGQAVIVETYHDRIPYLISAPTTRTSHFGRQSELWLNITNGVTNQLERFYVVVWEQQLAEFHLMFVRNKC